MLPPMKAVRARAAPMNPTTPTVVCRQRGSGSLAAKISRKSRLTTASEKPHGKNWVPAGPRIGKTVTRMAAPSTR
jgi:hypothetical protein